ncbi:MAG: hypothetical protein NVS3B26_20650 [Mycobacteriales bacterium]
MTPDARERIWEAVDAAWLATAAARVMYGHSGEPSTLLDSAARQVVDAAKLPLPTGDIAMIFGRALRSQLAQMLAVVDPAATVAWAELDDKTLLAQGRGSGANIGAVLAPNGPVPPEMRARLSQPDAVFLDVGTGVGAICVAMCRSWPNLRCVGLDMASRPLSLAERATAEAGVANRVDLVQQDIGDLHDLAAFDAVWLPLVLIGTDVAARALRNAVNALRPGGWILVGVNEQPADDMQRALTGFRAAAVGGSTAFRDDVLEWLAQAGVTDISDVHPPSGGTCLVGRRPD